MQTREAVARQTAPSDPIGAFYTQHPYPPPVDNLDRAREDWRDEYRRRAEFHLVWPHRRYPAGLDILVAGCGTWQAAKYAISGSDSRVIGIDISPTSLAYTEQLKRRHALTNLTTTLLPLERVAELGRSFDLIVCTGVLHHLADPDAGLCALRDVLKPDGAINLMVYAPYGRAGIAMLQDYCRRLGVGTSTREVADLSEVLDALPRHHPMASLFGRSRDFAHGDALADALLNPRDRSYSVPELFDWLARNGLRLARWYLQAPYLPHCGAIAATPHAARLAALPEPDQYAAMELWRGTMTCHSAIVRHATNWSHEIRFGNEEWADYVPIRLPWAACVGERLPAGAAGVLLNRGHPYSDLILPIDAREKHLFDAVDGRRCIAEIAARASGSDGDEYARTFFERLYRHDHVAFDASPWRAS